MRTFHQLVFDETVEGTTDVFTSPTFNALLGLSDSLTISGYTNAVSVTSGTPTLTVRVQQGPDQRHWDDRNGTAEVNGATLSQTAETTFSGNDGSPVGATRPAFGRLKITLGGTGPKARVKIWVTGRGEQTVR